MSTHKVEVVRLGPVEKHPNADALEVTHIWGYTAILRLGEFKEGDLVAYIEPDYVVPETEQFAFLTDRRIRTKKLRGIWSQGLVIRAPEGTKEGDDVMDMLGVVRYAPEVVNVDGGLQLPHESLSHLSKYDVENLRRYVGVLQPSEPVYVSEKLDGANARFAWRDGQIWMGTRTNWVKPEISNSPWAVAVRHDPWIVDWCKNNQDSVLYGEIIGVNKLKYGLTASTARFRAFDILKRNAFLDATDFVSALDPQYRVHGWFDEFDVDKLTEVSMSNSWLYPDSVAEGIVIKPVKERWDPGVGRVMLKLVSDRYLAHAK